MHPLICNILMSRKKNTRAILTLSTAPTVLALESSLAIQRRRGEAARDSASLRRNRRLMAICVTKCGMLDFPVNKPCLGPFCPILPSLCSKALSYLSKTEFSDWNITEKGSPSNNWVLLVRSNMEWILILVKSMPKLAFPSPSGQAKPQETAAVRTPDVRRITPVSIHADPRSIGNKTSVLNFAWKMLGKGRFKGLGKNEFDSDSNESFFGVQTKIFRGSSEKQWNGSTLHLGPHRAAKPESSWIFAHLQHFQLAILKEHCVKCDRNWTHFLQMKFLRFQTYLLKFKSNRDAKWPSLSFTIRQFDFDNSNIFLSGSPWARLGAWNVNPLFINPPHSSGFLQGDFFSTFRKPIPNKFSLR